MYLFAHLFIYLFMYYFVDLFMYLFIYLRIYLFIVFAGLILHRQQPCISLYFSRAFTFFNLAFSALILRVLLSFFISYFFTRISPTTDVFFSKVPLSGDSKDNYVIINLQAALRLRK